MKVTKQRILNGADNIVKADHLLRGKRLGLITNASGVGKDMRQTIELVSENYNLCALFGPEHGVRGAEQAGVKIGGYTDSKFNVPVYSLYGDTKKPTKEMLHGIDAMLFDVQDATARFFTYLYTLAYAMESCAENGIPMIVLDRIAPLNGSDVEGTICDPAFSSFVGDYELPTRTGMTVGEFAGYVNDYKRMGCDLEIVEISGWNRQLYFDQTDACWVLPSPGLPTVDTNFVYIGTCIFEGVNVSEGRGTTKPFEIIAAPWLDTDRLVENMQKRGLNGMMLRKTSVTPMFSKYQNEHCEAVQIHITDRNACEPFRLGLYLLEEIWRLHPDKLEFIENKDGFFIDRLLGTDAFREEKLDADGLIAAHMDGISNFIEIKKKYELYQ